MLINELLAYANHYINSASVENVKKVILNFFSDDEIITAKRMLFTECSASLGTPTERKSTEKRKASVANVDDIFIALLKLDVEGIDPDILARNIDRVPDRQPEEVNLLNIVQIS